MFLDDRLHRPRPELQPPFQIALNELAEKLRCPNGFGTGKNARHWIPQTLDGCCRCGTDTQDILNQADQQGVAQ